MISFTAAAIVKSEMSEKTERKLPSWLLPILSWVVAGYFLTGTITEIGFPPNGTRLAANALLVSLSLLFLFLPFFNKIKIGKVLELEREVARAKEELREFKAEVRNNMSVLSTNVNTIGMTNQLTVNIPGAAELRAARELFEEKAPNSKQAAEEVERNIVDQSDDTILALARTRIDIERLLRTILRKRTSIAPGEEQTLKFAGINQLFEQFTANNSQLAYLRQPFRYVVQICNAAIHAQRVSEEQAKEALALGAQVIAVLKQFAGDAQ
jgi:hypothetical protein